MFANQAESCRIVIKFDFDPVDRRVTVTARSTHCFAMHVVVFVACDTIGWCFAMFLAGLMAITTGDIVVFSVQREVSGLVFERRLIERDDVCVSSLMFRMAE